MKAKIAHIGKLATPKLQNTTPQNPKDSQKMQLRPNTTLTTKTNNMTAIQALKEIHEEHVPVDADDETVPSGKQLHSTRLQLMVSNQPPSTSAEGLLKAVREILAAMKNKLPTIKFAKWQATNKTGKKMAQVDQIPSDIEKAELFLQNFSRFSSGKRGYFRIQVIHDDQVPIKLLEDISKSFNIPQQQSLYLASSDAVNPQVIGMIIGSTEAMATSPDTSLLFQKLSEVKVIGMTWKYINNGEKGKFNPHQKAIYIETESDTARKLKAFLTSYLNEEQQPIFGAALTFLPSNQYPTLNQTSKIRKYSPLQTNLITTLREYQVEISTFHSVTVNKPNDDKQKKSKTTLLELLLDVESIVPKTVVTSKETKSYNGKVFYAAVTDWESNITTFQYQEYNEQEATSILRALPLFIRDQFGIKNSKTMYRSAHSVAANNGKWDKNTRVFLSQQDLRENVQFENLELLTQAAPQTQYINADHQRLMMGAKLDDASDITDLRNLTDAPSAEPSALTMNTGSTRTSKAKVIAEKQIKEISRQYVQQQKEDRQRIQEQQLQLNEQTQQMAAMQKMMQDIMQQNTKQVSTLDSTLTDPKAFEYRGTYHSSSEESSSEESEATDDNHRASISSDPEIVTMDELQEKSDTDQDSVMDPNEEPIDPHDSENQTSTDDDVQEAIDHEEGVSHKTSTPETTVGPAPPSPKRKHQDTVPPKLQKRTTRSGTAGGKDW